MVMPIAWILNLDADEELRHPAGYRPTTATLRRMRRFVAQLRDLPRPGDVVLDIEPLLFPGAGRAPFLPGPFVGQAWCPTPSALEFLRRAGATLPATPPVDVLRHVNHRAFAADLGQTLQGARYVRSVDELRHHVERFPPGPWLLKRPHGFAGRGRRRVAFPDVAVADERWIAASLQQDDGLQAEPWVTRLQDFALHGYIEPSGSLQLGRPTVQECGRQGEWHSTRLAEPADLDADELTLLQQTTRSTARALSEAAYFGPFGIDAYRWRDAVGTQYFNPRSEINARYTMGWHVGMGEWRPVLQREGT